MTPLLVELGWKSAAVAALALILLRLFERRSAADKSAIATLAMLALAGLPLAALVLPSLQIALPALVGDLAQTHSPGAALQEGTASLASSPAGLGWQLLAPAAYVAVATVLVFLHAVALLRLRGVRLRCDELRDPAWREALGNTRIKLGISRKVDLLVSDEIAHPASWGVTHPIIVVNAASVEDRSAAIAVITHELAHVVRFDWVRLLLGRAATTLFWFNPLVWVLARRATLLCELGADDAVLHARVDRENYADLLLQSVRHTTGRELLATNGLSSSNVSISARIERILHAAAPRAPAGIGWLATCLVSTLGLSGLLAAAEPVIATAAAELDRPAVETAYVAAGDPDLAPSLRPASLLNSMQAATAPSDVQPSPSKVGPFKAGVTGDATPDGGTTSDDYVAREERGEEWAQRGAKWAERGAAWERRGLQWSKRGAHWSARGEIFRELGEMRAAVAAGRGNEDTHLKEDQ